MTIQNRKNARTGLVTAITNGVTELQAVYGYLVKDPAGQSPICTVESGPAQYSSRPANGNLFDLIVGMWVDRTGASAAEDLLDDLSYKLATVVNGWHNAYFSQPSQTDYIDLDNQAGQYRVEWHFIRVEWE